VRTRRRPAPVRLPTNALGVPSCRELRTTGHDAGEDLICLLVEPLGLDLWLGSGETFVVRTEADPEFAVSSVPGQVIVWIACDAYDVAVIGQANGDELTCGHRRPYPIG